MERDDVTRLAGRQLRHRTHLAWNRLANDYNRTHYSAELMNFVGERRVGERNAGQHLLEDRRAPWRSVAALRGQAPKWEEFSKLLKNSTQGRRRRNANGQYLVDSEDDEEVANPEPEIPAFEATRTKRKVDTQLPKHKKKARWEDVSAPKSTEGLGTSEPSVNDKSRVATRHIAEDVEGDWDDGHRPKSTKEGPDQNNGNNSDEHDDLYDA